MMSFGVVTWILLSGKYLLTEAVELLSDLGGGGRTGGLVVNRHCYKKREEILSHTPECGARVGNRGRRVKPGLCIKFIQPWFTGCTVGCHGLKVGEPAL